MEKIEKIEKKLNKRKVLWYSGLSIIIIFIAIIINIIVVYPVNLSNMWIYGIIILSAGLTAYFVALFLLETRRVQIENISMGVIILGEIFIMAYISVLGSPWISVYFVMPSITFFGLSIISYYFHPPELKNRQNINWGIMLISGSLFLFMIEAAFRDIGFFQSSNIPIYGFLIIIGGVILYVLATYKVFEKPSYIATLTGAFIINIGIVFIEIYYKFYDPIFMLIFLLPAAVFFVLLFINYRLLERDRSR